MAFVAIFSPSHVQSFTTLPRPSLSARTHFRRTSLSPTARPSARCQIRPSNHLTLSVPKCSSLSLIATTHIPPNNFLTIFSTIVGICVLIGSLLYKIPQVVRVLRRRSAAGISVLMYSLETIGTTFSAVYFARRRIPFSTYGESVFIMFQNFIILILIVFYQKLPRAPAIFLALLYIVSLFFLYSNFVSMPVLTILQICSIPIMNLARIPQILLNWRRKGTGELSPITLGLQLLGNVARIFTTIAQVKDPLMLTGIAVATCFNSTLFGQWMWYSGKFSSIGKSVTNS